MTAPASPSLPRVVLEHPDFYVVNKPPMWLTHQGRGRVDVPNVLDYLKWELGEPELAPPHRLDRETSGAQLFSRDADAARDFFTLFKERLLTKTYLTLVHGHPGWQTQTVNAPLDFLGLSESNAVIIRQGVVAGGKEALTRFEVLGQRVHPQHGALSLLAALPQSGRLHQIRAHLSELGLPMLGDKIYGRDPAAFVAFMDGTLSPQQQAELILPRQALHAWRLEFGWAGARMRVEVPMAADMAGVWGEAEKEG
ncbi:RluA family pseudouridine synthase [Deinococcus sp. KNUC1210]|uniref:RluA family pseudouridine synthase n=1 Tax=Deinococcus sp. KNUC1210 TaxID=2917691 RepID=UPI001EF0FA24|nr:RluA family pseudouridine synthase [Deinococcus sp. KNUC1210]ULH15961.1 RluA family pseudouridine synthase [Deinococcus sp. KNUC1210]